MKSNEVIDTLLEHRSTEHISRKWGQWYPDPAGLLEQLGNRGFHITRKK